MYKIAFLICVSIASLSANEYNTPFQLPETKEPERKTLLLDQVDETDVYAIPYDSSEVEDEIQIDSLYNQQRRQELKKQQAPAK